MIKYEEAIKRLEQEPLFCAPNDRKRLVVPAYGFSGAVDAKRAQYLPPTYEKTFYDVKGFEFYNPTDDATQVLKQEDGVFLMYDSPGLQEKVQEYLNQNPDALKSVKGLQKFVEFVTPLTINPKTGKGDIYDSDVEFAANLIGAPHKDKIKPGVIFTGTKKKDTVKAIYLQPGEKTDVFRGQEKTAGKDGAYIISDKDGIRFIQADEFKSTYAVVSDTQQKIEVFTKAGEKLKKEEQQKQSVAELQKTIGNERK